MGAAKKQDTKWSTTKKRGAAQSGEFIVTRNSATGVHQSVSSNPTVVRTKNERLNLRVSSDLKCRLSHVADAIGKKAAEVATEAIENTLDQLEKELGATKLTLTRAQMQHALDLLDQPIQPHPRYNVWAAQANKAYDKT
ncbi:hypothetical protein [Pseudovibrio sp. Tun.PSC04-5.I4]|uniref:hypothetical protein n=1 Tax=Pseudovibrio sp. Tun.PSC04-5.I4 TaxID=1798213 RepID=UPI00088EF8C0|nr:hypothetical protein [Pseudovibrio sp. Tun.PSC04-5.I4]SDQ32326.1 Uncharacterized conserved protein, DUF1778 family [Pseudovibrio sp. Tun.PSC04-5.I4]SDR45719.1 Uncharacterized conserved protein, DUF1778 family [Pseudovibrio sp. Tun.PSC04-5.I4]